MLFLYWYRGHPQAETQSNSFDGQAVATVAGSPRAASRRSIDRPRVLPFFLLDRDALPISLAGSNGVKSLFLSSRQPSTPLFFCRSRGTQQGKAQNQTAPAAGFVDAPQNRRGQRPDGPLTGGPSPPSRPRNTGQKVWPFARHSPLPAGGTPTCGRRAPFVHPAEEGDQCRPAVGSWPCNGRSAAVSRSWASPTKPLATAFGVEQPVSGHSSPGRTPLPIGRVGGPGGPTGCAANRGSPAG